jgi:oligosaccharide repeat unit polymerase
MATLLAPNPGLTAARTVRRPTVSPNRVSQPEWLLSVLSLLVAIVSFLADTGDEIAIVIGTLVLLTALQLIAAIRQSLQSGVMGRPLLVGSLLIAFYGEAFVSSLQNPAFRMPFEAPVGFDQFPIRLVRIGLVYVALFQLATLAGYSLRFRATARMFNVAKRQDRSESVVRVALYVFAACAWVPLIASYGFDFQAIGQVLLSSRHAISDVAGRDAGLLVNFSSLSLFGSAALFAKVIFSRSPLKLLDLVVACIGIVPTIASGTRYRLLYIFIPLLVIAFDRLVKQRQYRRLTLIALGGMLMLMVFQTQVAVRRVGWSHLLEMKGDTFLAMKPTLQFDSLLFAVYLVPRHHPYFMEPMTPYFFIHWVPRSLWPNKPIAKSFEYYNATWTRGAKLKVFNVTPSIMGEYHLNWGVFGVPMIGLWIGFLLYLSDECMLRTNVAKPCLAAVAIGMAYAFILASLRDYAPVYFVHFAIGAAATYFLTRRASLVAPGICFRVPDPKLRSLPLRAAGKP